MESRSERVEAGMRRTWGRLDTPTRENDFWDSPNSMALKKTRDDDASSSWLAAAKEEERTEKSEWRWGRRRSALERSWLASKKIRRAYERGGATEIRKRETRRSSRRETETEETAAPLPDQQPRSSTGGRDREPSSGDSPSPPLSSPPLLSPTQSRPPLFSQIEADRNRDRRSVLLIHRSIRQDANRFREGVVAQSLIGRHRLPLRRIWARFRTGDAFVESRLLIAVLSIIIAVLVGCVAIFFVWRSSRRKPAEPPKPLVVKTQMDTEEDQGKKKVTVFFGTQTRTAEGFAKALAEEAKARYPNAIFKLVDIDEYATEDDEYEENLKKESLALFFLATGKREEPGWKIFNLVAVVVDELLHEQGAKHIVQVGLGDDNQGIEDDFSAWRELLWPELDKLLQDENETGALLIQLPFLNTGLYLSSPKKFHIWTKV
ncbi:hypothetical protein ZIOFF_062323 [Zingiber officinale]|uniref:Flavodoxin-like domain-containing protein n=1 Tax=Zingiber officinale TaxID=94328 RepID=A0A8J5F0N0_ZINOF|nr:hypothetical protein ZIOFF_062323 [Zingiber officinale]